MLKRNNYTIRVSIIASVVNSPDAISETVLADLEAFDRVSQRMRRSVDVRVLCCASNVADSRIKLFDDWRDVVRDEHFQTSDLYIYHFGIFHSIHDTMPFTRRDSFVSVFFHNVTPPQYFTGGTEEVLHNSYQQIENFRAANVIMTGSNFSRETLLNIGLDKPIVVTPLFGPNATHEPPASRPARRPGAALKILFCGRFTPSKGVLTLTEAIRRLSPREDCPVELTMTGMMEFSEADYVKEIRRSITALPKTVRAMIMPDLDSEQLKQLFLETDVFVLPSLHEGFGMPVVEALSAGTPVICSDAGALPEVTGGLALTFASRNVDDLTVKLEKFRAAFVAGAILCDRAPRPIAAWRTAALAYGKRFTREAYIGRISEHFSRWLDSCAGRSDTYRERLARLGAALVGGTRDGKRPGRPGLRRGAAYHQGDRHPGHRREGGAAPSAAVVGAAGAVRLRHRLLERRTRQGRLDEAAQEVGLGERSARVVRPAARRRLYPRRLRGNQRGQRKPRRGGGGRSQGRAAIRVDGSARRAALRYRVRS